MVCAWMPWVASTSNKAAFAGRQGPAHFITEINVAGSINQVQDIFLPVCMLVIDLDGMALDGDALFPFQVHIIQHLVHHIPVADGTGRFVTSRSARVDLPWSICAMMQKLRIFFISSFSGRRARFYFF